MGRLLGATASELLAMCANELHQAIRLSDGRTVAAEFIATYQPAVEGVSNGEIAAAFGADVVVLDAYDVTAPHIHSAPGTILTGETPLADYAGLVGRPVGINLVVVDDANGEKLGGRRATLSNAERAVQQGANIIFLYHRPHMGGTHPMIVNVAAQIEHLDVMLVGVPTFSLPAPRTPQSVTEFQKYIDDLTDAGCTSVALPCPGTHRGWRWDVIVQLVDHIHSRDALAWLFVTGSIEGAQQETMQMLALQAKQSGADAVRLDEAGLNGMPVPENIYSFSVALRGRRHTFRRMASSIVR